MQDFIKIALGVLISALLVAFTFKVIKPATESIGKNLTGMETNLSVMNNEEYTQYSKGTIKGSDVAAAIELYKDKGIGILVQTLAQGSSSATLYTNYGAELTTNVNAPTTLAVPGVLATDVSNDTIKLAIYLDATGNPVSSTANISGIADKTNINQYIKGTGDFFCRLAHDSNGEISGIVFKQKN